MKATADSTNGEDEKRPEPSSAYPPLYVLRSAALCPECDEATHVYTLGCTAFRDAEDGGKPIGQFHFLHRIRYVPPEIIVALGSNCPDYRFDGFAGEPPYLMNHCPCGAKLDDDFLHGDVGAAFWPDTPAGFAAFRLFRLPATEPIAVECSYMIGGGEYLAIDGAEAW